MIRIPIWAINFETQKQGKGGGLPLNDTPPLSRPEVCVFDVQLELDRAGFVGVDLGDIGFCQGAQLL